MGSDLSLAESIRENTRAVQELTRAFLANFSSPIVLNASELMEHEAHAEHIVAAPAPLDYDADVKPAALKLAKSNRDALVAILDGFGVKKATELKPAQYADFLKQCAAASQQ